MTKGSCNVNSEWNVLSKAKFPVNFFKITPQKKKKNLTPLNACLKRMTRVHFYQYKKELYSFDPKRERSQYLTK